MSKVIHVKLNSKSIKDALKELDDYKKWLDLKTIELTERLVELGIEVAEEHSVDRGGIFGTHLMGQYVSFEMKVEGNVHGATRILVGFGDDVASNVSLGRSINALYALEFGTAALGLAPYKGTNSQAGHEDDLTWYAYDEETKSYKLLSAIMPTRPMHNAYLQILDSVQSVAKEVFV